MYIEITRRDTIIADNRTKNRFIQLSTLGSRHNLHTMRLWIDQEQDYGKTETRILERHITWHWWNSIEGGEMHVTSKS